MKTPITISPETLRQWLSDGHAVTVLDIRKAEDRAEWSIPGSLHVEAYDALKAHHPDALAGVAVPSDVPVVTVCGVGRIAATAAEQLQARGVPAMALAGGMKAWSGAWNTAEVSLPTTAVQVIQVRRTGKGCLSYLVASDNEAVVIDAALDPQVYLDLAAGRGWNITRVLETHVHADHLSRARLLADAADAELMLPEQNRVAFPFVPVRDNDRIQIGSHSIEALRTPGHTLDSTSFVIEGQAVFTGDTLFLSGVGRPDLGASNAGARERATMLYHSLRRLLELPPSVLVLPGHHSQPIEFDRQPLAISLKELTKKVSVLSQPEHVFVEWILSRIPPTPPNYLEIVRLNEAGVLPTGNPIDLEAGANRCAVS